MTAMLGRPTNTAGRYDPRRPQDRRRTARRRERTALLAEIAEALADLRR